MPAPSASNPDPRDVPSVAARAVKRFWQRRASGQAVSVDEVLELTPTDADYHLTRATTIRLIADEAHKVSGSVDEPDLSNHDRVTQPGTHAGAELTRASSPAPHAATTPPASAFGVSTITDTPRPGPTPLPKIEGYDVIACLGRGGMGVVYEAYQQSTGRRVAIKFMLDAALANEGARKRFELEVEVVARLQHPGIVSIIDSGVRKGKYFYVMEFVEGRPLDLAMPAGQCEVRAALRMMIQICEGVDYAHQRGILHRDLKPSNIIVDAAGQPHLLDFGLAKLVGDDDGNKDGAHGKLGLTMSQPGQLLGTIAYMSPEQAGGRHDETSVRTDVYALGAIAYEMVTGELPVRMGGSLKQILTWIAEEDPETPSGKRKGLDKDIDAILLKPLEKPPASRYATAGEFAADIKRYLAHVPIIARRVGPIGKSVRWVQRNRALAAAIAIGVSVLIGVSSALIGGILTETKRANAAAAEAKSNAETAETNASIAKANEEEAKRQSEAADRQRREAAEALTLLRNLLESVEPDQAKTVPQLVDKMSTQIDESAFEFDRTEAVVREIIANMQKKLGDYDKAVANLSKAVPIRERHASGDDPDLATSLHELAATLWWLGKIDLAEPLYERSYAMRRRLYTTDKAELADSLTHMGALRLRQGRLPDSKGFYTEALDMRRRMFGQEDAKIAPSLNNLAKVHMELEEYEQAESLFRQSLNMMLRERGENDSGTAFASQNLAACLLEKGDAVGAKAAYDRAYTIRATTFKDKKHHLMAASLCGLAQAELALGNASEALSRAHAGLDMYRATRKEDHPDVADALQVMGRALLATDKAQEAREHFDAAYAIVMKVQPPDPLRAAELQIDQGQSLVALGERERGLALLEEGFRTVRSRRGEKSRITAREAERVSAVYEKLGDHDRAESYAQVARQARQSP